jgi:hypothetical protein
MYDIHNIALGVLTAPKAEVAMAAYQRVAWIYLVICAFVLAGMVTLGLNFGWSKALPLTAAFSLVGVASLLLRPWRSDQVYFDERDRAIQNLAGRVALGAVWVGLFIGVSLLVASDATGSGTIPIKVVPWFLVGMTFVFLVTLSVTVLLCYRKAR